MATQLSVKQLLPWVHNATIKVKVFRRAESLDNEDNPKIDFIFVDIHGSKIHATVKKHNYDHFQRALTEGAWREIRNVNVVPTERWHNKLTDHDYMIILDRETQVWPLGSLSGNHFLRFREFEEIAAGRHDTAFPVDLIGYIGYMGRLSPQTSDIQDRRSIHFHIKNMRNVELYCIAYGDLAVDIHSAWKSHHNANVLCVMSEWRCVKSDGEIIIVDGGGLSRVWFNPSTIYDVSYQARISTASH